MAECQSRHGIAISFVASSFLSSRSFKRKGPITDRRQESNDFFALFAFESMYRSMWLKKNFAFTLDGSRRSFEKGRQQQL
mmetsp:Transcript_2846/g.4176  ORF Transcript_2846/g.4176 Transcript_2846/m.4176 type:complete len:80 (+) Transcript_2846:1064-1303(+)